ncbi:MAG: aminoacyl-tRNA hydrolase [Spirochaetaceae bacterium]|jgi:PTH1 family peptidyl-tRNA hydrolase|nr:aminoacyl-tRNA hydrolase [Spirochaetaceae bacterium]
MLSLIVFLGNPGPGYRNNRHNAGRLLAERLPFFNALGWQKKFKALYGVKARESGAAGFGAGPDRIHFIMPETYMNLSGEAVQKAAGFYKLDPPRIMAVHDELELPLGTISLKYAGGLGGHNGLRSIKAHLGSADFWRLRIGIGRPPGRLPGEGGPPGSGGDVTGWVLADFTAAETPALDAALEGGAELLIRALAAEPESILGEWSRKKLYPVSGAAAKTNRVVENP